MQNQKLRPYGFTEYYTVVQSQIEVRVHLVNEQFLKYAVDPFAFFTPCDYTLSYTILYPCSK